MVHRCMADHDTTTRLDFASIPANPHRATAPAFAEWAITDSSISPRAGCWRCPGRAGQFVRPACTARARGPRLLLPLVPPQARRAVRERMIWVAAAFEPTSEPVEAPRARVSVPSPRLVANSSTPSPTAISPRPSIRRRRVVSRAGHARRRHGARRADARPLGRSRPARHRVLLDEPIGSYEQSLTHAAAPPLFR